MDATGIWTIMYLIEKLLFQVQIPKKVKKPGGIEATEPSGKIADKIAPT